MHLFQSWNLTYWASAVTEEPRVDAVGVELVKAWEEANFFPRLAILQADTATVPALRSFSAGCRGLADVRLGRSAGRVGSDVDHV
jgi:hypothetical protein